MTLSGFFFKNPKFTIKIDLDNVIGMGCIFLPALLWFMREKNYKYYCCYVRYVTVTLGGIPWPKTGSY